MVNPSWPLSAFTVLTTSAREITVLLVQLLTGFPIMLMRTGDELILALFFIDLCPWQRWSQPELISYLCFLQNCGFMFNELSRQLKQ